MFLIMSAAYVGQELESEFGKIPPSFLPLGNRRLFQHQVKNVPGGLCTYLSVPQSFSISDFDQKWLKRKKVNIIYTPDNLSLGASLVAALNLSEHDLDNNLHILFGDTLIPDLPNYSNNDIVGVSDIKEYYNWAYVSDNSGDHHWIANNGPKVDPTKKRIVNGYFKFSKPRSLIKAITQAHWDFIAGLNRYHKDIGLSEIKTGKWLDFGHVNTYYHSKSEFTTQRAFNELTICNEWVEKYSRKNKKIRAEANWFESIPKSLRIYIPQFLGVVEENDYFSYRLEYLHYTALNELYVFSDLPSIKWKQILENCLKFIKLCEDFKRPMEIKSNSLKDLFGEKTLSRLKEYCHERNIDFEEKWNFNNICSASIKDVINYSENFLPQLDKRHGLLHGDFCFSNILYDFRSQRIKTIDPRGITHDGNFSIYGDYRYDLAKLSHSVLGMYDWIIAGYYNISIVENMINFYLGGRDQHKETQKIFIELVNEYFSLTEENLISMQIQLFFSMLPLHSDDEKRQNALFANAFRLYDKLKRLSS